jgi:hypothetical protein
MKEMFYQMTVLTKTALFSKRRKVDIISKHSESLLSRCFQRIATVSSIRTLPIKISVVSVISVGLIKKIFFLPAYLVETRQCPSQM